MELQGVEWQYERGEAADDISHLAAENTPIKFYHYPFCCTGAVLAGFGGSADAYDRHEGYDRTELETHITAWINYIKLNTKKQFISACTTCEQEEANIALEALGFTRTEGIPNRKYGGLLYTWTLILYPKGEE